MNERKSYEGIIKGGALKAHSQRAETEAKAKFFFDVCRLFIDLLNLFFDLFALTPA